MSRPAKYTNAQIAAALRKSKGAIFVAARQLGCDVSTIHRRLARSKLLARVLEAERGEFVDTAELKLYSAVLAGEPWAVAMVLKTLGKSRGYVERQEFGSTPGAEPVREIHEIVVHTREEAREFFRRQDAMKAERNGQSED